ncbi:Zn(II)2Cys6 transcription factor domain-containing protein [Sporobolomyces koalae]|uniref:Zn(II)2Cys6 transcription factor domain-containing protein n=1 Tax=Sporobolomyces koalae TaxID=500713 RepID=UPI00317899D6
MNDSHHAAVPEPTQQQRGQPEDSSPAASATGSGNGAGSAEGVGKKSKRGPVSDGRRHLSCENCRIRKMRCSRTEPCLSCKMRGDECVWIGAAPNGSATEDEVEATQGEVNRLKKLVDLLLTRLEQQDAELDRHVLRPGPSRQLGGAVADISVPSNSVPGYNPHRPHFGHSWGTHEPETGRGGGGDIV